MLTSKTVNHRRSTHTKFATKGAYSEGECFAGEWIVTCGPRSRPGMLFDIICYSNVRVILVASCASMFVACCRWMARHRAAQTLVSHTSAASSSPTLLLLEAVGGCLQSTLQSLGVVCHVPANIPPLEGTILDNFDIAKQVLQGQTTRS